MPAEKQTQESSERQQDAKMRAFGLGHGGLTVEPESSEEEEKKPEEQVEGESDEPENKADASPEKAASGETESEEEKPEPKAKPAEEQKPDPKVEAAEKAKQEAEQRERKLQGRLDRQEHLHSQEVQALYQQFESLKQSIVKSNGDDGVKADDLVDKKTVERLIQDAVGKATATGSKSMGPTNEQMRYIQLHPEYDEVIKFGNETNYFKDQNLTAIPTDAVGLFLATQNKRLTTQIEKMQKDHKSALDKALAAERKKIETRGKVPPTGGGGSRKGDDNSSVVEELTATERMFTRYFDKHAGGKSRVVQVKR